MTNLELKLKDTLMNAKIGWFYNIETECWENLRHGADFDTVMDVVKHYVLGDFTDPIDQSMKQQLTRMLHEEE